MNYPTEEYETYADCDDHFVRKSLPPGLKPFWTVDNISEATEIFYFDNETTFEQLGSTGKEIILQLQESLSINWLFNSELFSGAKVSDCLCPCLRTVANVEEGTITNVDGRSLFSLMFNEEVRVKKTRVDKFSFMDSLNFFGSNLGLWPGLGLFQILEWMAGIFLVSKLFKRIGLFRF